MYYISDQETFHFTYFCLQHLLALTNCGQCYRVGNVIGVAEKRLGNLVEKIDLLKQDISQIDLYSMECDWLTFRLNVIIHVIGTFSQMPLHI